MQNIRWAVLGTGVIANEMAVALKKNGRNIDAVGNRTHEKAVAFAEKYGIKKVYDNYNDMFTDPDIDVIYITTPHNTHIDFMRRAIENGKHILVEKSITLNSRELDEAALMDGCGHFRLLFQILLPLMKPVISTVVIMTFLRLYNDLIFSMLLISDKKMATMSVALMAFKSEYDINYGGTFAAICVSVLPIIAIYIAFQKQIEAGLAAGSVKG